jgi:OOP family OmpA-OmpF porin
LGLIFFLIGIWSFQIYSAHRRWANFMDSLRNEPGIVVTTEEKNSGRHLILGLRDPLAPDPQNMLQKTGIDSEKVRFHWEPYHSAYPAYANQRIQNILKPPDTINLELKDGTLYAQGCARHEWLLDTRKLVKIMPWIQELRDDDVTDIDLTIDPPETVSIEVKGNSLYASGAAPHDWVIQTRQLVTSLPGILHFEEDNLIDTDLRTLENIKKKIESQVIFFKIGGKDFAPGQNAAINDLVESIRQLLSLAKIFDRRPQLEIIGHSDNRGTEELNIQISRERAKTFRLLLDSKGIAAETIIAKGVGTKEPLREEISEQDRAYNRSVTFKVHDSGHSQ